jgi:UDP-N-acetylmuramyl tripeptide synthase
VVLLNLSRDQLDRNNEVRHVAQRWRQMCEEAPPGALVVANADDPLVAWAASGATAVTWVGAGLRWRGDATGCPACGGQVVFGVEAGGTTGSSRDDGWACASCGLSRPALDIWLGPGGSEIFVAGVGYPVPLGLPGRCNRANAAMALGAALAMGASPGESLAGMATVHDVAGRYTTVQVGETSARLLLAKNPAGWAEVFDLLVPSPSPVVVAINARVADGHDPSWLWDVAFEELRGRRVVATGERGLDMAVRLHYAGVEHIYVPSLLGAVTACGRGPVDVVANYTAFHQLLANVRSDRQASGTGDGSRTGPGRTAPTSSGAQ